jgi:hypothetical protein
MSEQTVDPVEAEYERLKARKQETYVKKEVKYDKKNYLTTTVSKTEKQKEFNVRIIPIEKDSRQAWFEIHSHWDHSVKKSFVCVKKTKNLPEGTHTNCPYCEIEEDAWAVYRTTKDEIKKDKMKDIAKKHSSMAGFAIRLIDRDDESFGPKFLKVTENMIDDIMAIKKQYKKAGIDIFDYEKGRDICLTYEHEMSSGKSKFKTMLASLMESPLHESKEVYEKWVNNEKKWSDVYTIKSYEYLQIILSGGEPWFDKPSNKWIDKKDLR